MTEGASLPGEFALAIAARVQNSADIHDPPDVFLANFHALAPHEQHLLATHWCDYEVRNGGFLQFFENSTGVLAPEAVCGFRALGLPEVAAKIEDAMNRLASSFPRNRALRRAKIRELRALLGGTTKLFDEYDDWYYTFLLHGDIFEHAADAYARAHVV